MIARIDATNPTIQFAEDKYKLSFDIKSPVKARQMILTVREKQIDKLVIEVDKPRNRRSLRSNSFMWEICGRIAEVTKSGIRQTGNYYELAIEEDKIDHFKGVWKGHGEGWFADVIDYYEDKPGFKRVFAYYGSSQYDTQQMSQLIDFILDGAKDLGIEVLSERERSLLENG